VQQFGFATQNGVSMAKYTGEDERLTTPTCVLRKIRTNVINAPKSFVNGNARTCQLTMKQRQSHNTQNKRVLNGIVFSQESKNVLLPENGSEGVKIGGMRRKNLEKVGTESSLPDSVTTGMSPYFHAHSEEGGVGEVV
jgi:hypothetical protein